MSNAKVKIELNNEKDTPKKLTIKSGDKETGIRESFVKGTAKEVSKKDAKTILSDYPQWFNRVETKEEPEVQIAKTKKK